MTKSKQRLTGKERQIQILQEAKNLCAQKGFAGTKLDEIAQKAGVSRVLVIQHFGNKEKLYESLINYLFKSHPIEKDPDIKKNIESKNDFGVFKSYFQHISKYMTEDKKHSPLRLIFFSMLEKPDLYEKHYYHRRTKGLAVLEKYISERIKDGVFQKVNPRCVAIVFSAMVIQLLIQEITAPCFESKEVFTDCIDTMINLLLKGLKQG